MRSLLSFLRELNEDDVIVFILSNEFIVGRVTKKFDAVEKCIELSDVYISGTYIGKNITISTEHIIGWGKK